jgi:CRISPR-associated protein Cmr2
MDDTKFWQTKMAARLHDPGEKALILGRTREGHEGGTVRALRETLFPQGVPQDVEQLVQRADWWAAAADRPQWPRDLADRVDWTKDPVLIHSVSGREIDLRQQGRLQEIDPSKIAEKSRVHFERLIAHCGGDPRKILLAFWRFGPELVEERDGSKLGALWEQLPADTRVPDHSIWEHLDLVSAFAGAFAADSKGEVALLTLAIGPVQPFIAAARSTSDLWAGSHLLSRLAWEAMRPVCEELGPDTILFPRLRAIPQVDLWLRDQGLPDELFATAPWRTSRSADTNPLFAAALPNRFVALVPASRARQIAETCRDNVRDWLKELGEKTARKLCEVAGINDESAYLFEQVRRQLAGFPEVHWAAVPFSLIDFSNDGAKVTGTTRLAEAMAPFFETTSDREPGFLGDSAWRVLSREIAWDDSTRFFTPNPGTLYPALYDLVERLLAAAKSVRAFAQLEQHGWRDSITGEAEWLTDNPDHLKVPAGKRRSRHDGRDFKEGEHVETLWTRIADRKPSWAKPGEHLSALSAIKRLWPTLYAEELQSALGIDFGRFVVSTHTMALAHQLDQWLERSGLRAEGFAEAGAKLVRDRVAMPVRIMLRHQANPALGDARTLLALLEEAQESDDEREAAKLRELVRKTLANVAGERERAAFRLETYYGLLLMDGDRMGELLSKGGYETAHPTFLESFHPSVRKHFRQKAGQNERLAEYGKTPRPPSPGRHMAISGALNDFALHVVPHIVQREYLGRLIYGGGDDVLAMLPVADLIPAAARLRDAWSGTHRFSFAPDANDSQRKRLQLKNGFAYLDDRLMRMMGDTATASAGVVVAHHQAPLAAVMRELRAAEQRAKNEGGRDALSISVIKRSGGMLNVTLKWGEQVQLLVALRNFLADRAVSRRAVYNSLEWLKDLPPDAPPEMLGTLLAYQLRRQTASTGAWRYHDGEGLAKRLSAEAVNQSERLAWLARFMGVAEFLARETRTPAGNRQDKRLPSESEAGATA